MQPGDKAWVTRVSASYEEGLPHHNLLDGFDSTVLRELPDTKGDRVALLRFVWMTGFWLRDLLFGYGVVLRKLVIKNSTVLGRKGVREVHGRTLLREVGVVSIHEVVPKNFDIVLRVDSSAIVAGTQSVENVEAVDWSVATVR